MIARLKKKLEELKKKRKEIVVLDGNSWKYL